MKTFLTFLTLFVCLNFQFVFGQLSGTAFLSGQTNHSGIKVKFTAASGTAVSDSCLTGASGTYSISIAGGLYYISFSKTGYQSHMYNNASITALTNTVVLQTLTLAVGTVSYVTGAVSGSWAGNVTYLVSGNLNVPMGSTLTIQPGAEIKFLGNYSLTVNGVLNASGTAVLPIRFMPSVSTGSWSEVNLYGGPNTLDHCDFSNFTGISNWNAAFSITNCRISNAKRYGISIVDGSGTIENNVIVDSPLGISGFANSATITCNRISSPLYKNDMNVINRGINITGSDRFTDNEIWDCQEGIRLRDFSGTPVVKNNYIHHTSHVGIYVEANTSPTLLIANNTLHQNYMGVYGIHQGLTLSNNVVTSSAIGIFGSGMTLDHNLIFNCMTNFSINPTIIGLGQIVNTNTNGDPIDSYYNLFMDPNYGTMMPSFLPGSPVLNAGNLSQGPNVGANVNTLCFSSLTTGLTEKSLSDYKVFPNPSYGVYTIEMPGALQLRVYTLAGVEILKRNFEEDKIIVNISDQPAGIYFCEIRGRNNTKLIKLIHL